MFPLYDECRSYIGGYEVPVDAESSIYIVRRSLEGHRESRNEARPFDPDPIDDGASEDSTDEAHGVTQRGCKIR